MKKVILMDFYADWCGPCRMLSRVIDQVKEQLAPNPNVSIQKINVETQPELAQEFGINMLPTVVIYNDVGGSWANMGVGTKDLYVNKIRELLQ